MPQCQLLAELRWTALVCVYYSSTYCLLITAIPLPTSKWWKPEFRPSVPGFEPRTSCMYGRAWVNTYTTLEWWLTNRIQQLSYSQKTLTDINRLVTVLDMMSAQQQTFTNYIYWIRLSPTVTAKWRAFLANQRWRHRDIFTIYTCEVVQDQFWQSDPDFLPRFHPL